MFDPKTLFLQAYRVGMPKQVTKGYRALGTESLLSDYDAEEGDEAVFSGRKTRKAKAIIHHKSTDGADVMDKPIKPRKKELYKAVKKSDLSTVQEALATGSKKDFLSMFRKSPLDSAIKRRAWDIVAELVAKGFKPEEIESVFSLAHAYSRGLGCLPEDHKTAFTLFEKAAEKGYSTAMIRLAECYQHGIGTEVDEDKAISWYQTAAIGNYSGEVQYQLALIYLNSGNFSQHARGLQQLKTAASFGHSEAQYELANEYLTGDHAIPDRAKALHWLHIAAERHGSEKAMAKLNELYAEARQKISE